MSDLIKREDAIKAIHNYWKKRLDTLPTKESECGEVYADIQQMDKIFEHNKTLCNFINAIPSADRPQEWIPCSKRKPEKAGHYLCSFKKANRIDNIYVDLAYWTGSRWYGYLANEINAWMPLPKPWKGADDE